MYVQQAHPQVEVAAIAGGVNHRRDGAGRPASPRSSGAVSKVRMSAARCERAVVVRTELAVRVGHGVASGSAVNALVAGPCAGGVDCQPVAALRRRPPGTAPPRVYRRVASAPRPATRWHPSRSDVLAGAVAKLVVDAAQVTGRGNRAPAGRSRSRPRVRSRRRRCASRPVEPTPWTHGPEHQRGARIDVRPRAPPARPLKLVIAPSGP